MTLDLTLKPKTYYEKKCCTPYWVRSKVFGCWGRAFALRAWAVAHQGFLVLLFWITANTL